MGFIKRNKEKNQNMGDLKNITTKSFSKKYSTEGSELCIILEDAFYSHIDGEEVLLDRVMVEAMLDEISISVAKNNTKYNPMPKNILITRDNKLDNSSLHNNQDVLKKSSNSSEKQEILDIYEPRYDFENVYIASEEKKQIINGLIINKHRDKLFNEWGLANTMKSERAVVFNFYGPPGTGKSMTAEAIASYLNKKVFSVNYSQLESKYVGETPKNIKELFRRAKEEDAVLIFDEADSFLGKRLTNITQSADYGVNITRSVMLLELERFNGVVIFTTNLLTNYDEAFKRRILANIEFKLPDEEGRKKIWEAHIPKKMPMDTEVDFDMLAKFYDNISGADIKDIVLFAAVNSIEANREYVNKEDFDLAYKYIRNRYNVDNKDFKQVKIKTESISEEQYLKEMNCQEV